MKTNRLKRLLRTVAQSTLALGLALPAGAFDVVDTAGTKHRLENPGKVPLFLIEVQSGGYLGEDDIVRFDDRYQRS